MSMGPSPRSLIAMLTMVSTLMIGAPAPAFATPTASAVISLVDGDGYSAEVPIHLPAHREPPAAKDAVLRILVPWPLRLPMNLF